MKRLLVATLLFVSTLALAQTLQNPGVPHCNQWGFCPPFAVDFLDAGEATVGLVEAQHIGGGGGSPTCLVDGGVGFTSCAVHGNDLVGTVVLTGVPFTSAGTFLVSLKPSVSFDGGFTCMVTPANADAGVAYPYLMTNTVNGTCNVGIASGITVGWPGASGSTFSYVMGGH